MEKDLIIKVELKMLSVEVTSDLLFQELCKEHLDLNLGQEEVDSRETRCNAFVHLQSVHLSKSLSMNCVRIRWGLFEIERLRSQRLKQVNNCEEIVWIFDNDAVQGRCLQD